MTSTFAFRQTVVALLMIFACYGRQLQMQAQFKPCTPDQPFLGYSTLNQTFSVCHREVLHLGFTWFYHIKLSLQLAVIVSECLEAQDSDRRGSVTILYESAGVSSVSFLTIELVEL